MFALSALVGGAAALATLFTGADEALLSSPSARLALALACTVAAPAFSGLLGVGIGLLAARRTDWIDPGLRSLIVAGCAACLAGLALIGTLWFAAQGALATLLTNGPGVGAGISALSTLLIPATVVVFAATLLIAVRVRAATRIAAVEAHVQTARSRGIPTAALVIRRVLRRTLPPALAVVLVEGLVLYAGFLAVHAVFTTPSLAADLPLLPSDSLQFVLGAALLCVVGITLAVLTAAAAPLGQATTSSPPVAITAGRRQGLLAPHQPPRPRRALPSAGFRSADLLDVRDLRLHGGGPHGPRLPADGIILTVTRGQALAVVGGDSDDPSTLCRAVAGLLPLDRRVLSGSILFDGTELVGLAEWEFRRLRGNEIGFLGAPATDSLDPEVRVGTQLAGRPGNRLDGGRSRPGRGIAALLTAVGIDDVAAVLRAYPAQLPRAVQQSVLLAGALIGQPRLLIADDPTAGLEPAEANSLLDRLHALQRERGFTLLLASSRPELIHRCDRVAVMSGGAIVEHAAVNDLLRAPQHPYSRRLLAGDPAPSRPVG